MKEHISNRRVLLGIILLLIGATLLLQMVGLNRWFPFDIPGWVFSWKTLLIVLGVILAATERNASTGLWLIFIGGIFLARDIWGLQFWSLMKFAIPALFLIAGLMVLIPGRFSFRRRRRLSYGSKDNDPLSRKDVIEEVCVFSGGGRSITSDNFKGGEITCIFGGSEINFRHASLSPGENIIDVTCIFGGVTLYVPEDWTVVSEVTSVFGGFGDKRAESKLSFATNPEKMLYIRGVVIFGGGEIKLA